VAHFQMFEAALSTIQPNFPPGVLQSDPRFSNVYFNMSVGNDYTGPWNQGPSTRLKEEMQLVEDPIEYVLKTNGLLSHEAKGTTRTEKAVQEANRQTSKLKSAEVNGAAAPDGLLQWNDPAVEESTGQKETSHKKQGAHRGSHSSTGKDRK